MMNTHECPKCGSKQILKIPGSIGEGGNSIATGITIFSAVKVTRFACRDCRFTEEWIESPEDMEALEHLANRSWFANPPPEEGVV